MENQQIHRQNGQVDGLEAINQASFLISQMVVLRVEVEDLGSTMEVAFEGDLSFYDSSYLHMASSKA